jgi:hypothetical protein
MRDDDDNDDDSDEDAIAAPPLPAETDPHPLLPKVVPAGDVA